MSAEKEIVIKDACVLFDLIDLGILKQFYQLDITVYTTPEVIAEITDEAQLTEVNNYIENGRLRIDEYGTFETIVTIIAMNPGLSFADGSVIELAIRINATVLSSDKGLRNEAQRRSLKVRGVIWVIEELEKNGIIDVKTAIEVLNKYPQVNKRAPVSEIEKLIRKYLQQ